MEGRKIIIIASIIWDNETKRILFSGPESTKGLKGYKVRYRGKERVKKKKELKGLRTWLCGRRWRGRSVGVGPWQWE
jgi:hypothetical protein